MSVSDLLVPNNYDLFARSITTVGGEDPVIIGTNATAAGGSGCVAVGLSATATGTLTTCVGAASSAVGNDGTACGANSSAGAANAVAVGKTAFVTAGALNAICIGADTVAGAAAVNSVCIGAYANTANQGDISLGYRAGETDPVGTGVIKIASIPTPIARAASSNTVNVPITINGTVYYLMASTVN